MTGPARELDDRQAARLDRGAQRAAHGLAHRHRLGAAGIVETELVEQPREPLGVRRARVDDEAHAAGNDVHAARLDLQAADGGHGAVDGNGYVPDAQDLRRRRDEGVRTSFHRRRAGVAGAALEVADAALVADDARDDAERRARLREARALLVVELEPCAGQATSLAPGATADAAALLLAEGHDRQGAPSATEPFERLDAGDHSERAVVAAALWDRVEMRARPDLGQLGLVAGQPAEQVAVRIDLDLEAGLPQPAGGELVRRVLLPRVADAVRPRPASDRVEVVETFEQAGHGTSLLPVYALERVACADARRDAVASVCRADANVRGSRLLDVALEVCTMRDPA